MKISHIIIVSLALGLLSACSYPMTDLKSPCVGAAGSPCERHDVNGWWLDKSNS